jgi:predicted DNA-binding transcriptional regulator AlpA
MATGTQTTTPAPAVLRLHAAAEYISMSASWLWHATQRGEVPCVRLGRAVRYRIRDLEQLLADRTERMT